MRNVEAKNKIECCGCGACEAVCPTDAIQMGLDEDGFYYPTVEKALCIGCEKCIRVCGFSLGITQAEERCDW